MGRAPGGGCLGRDWRVSPQRPRIELRCGGGRAWDNSGVPQPPPATSRACCGFDGPGRSQWPGVYSGPHGTVYMVARGLIVRPSLVSWCLLSSARNNQHGSRWANNPPSLGWVAAPATHLYIPATHVHWLARPRHALSCWTEVESTASAVPFTPTAQTAYACTHHWVS